VVELFAGVGGFRLGLERAGWRTVWANQWEPGRRVQHAYDCYVTRFGADGAVNRDVATISAEDVPPHDLLVGGFPCQDYSVARTLHAAAGIEGRKGVLWWQVHRIVQARRPRLVFVENVDRLLNSPAHQRGRDVAIMLACLSDLGYVVEWRVVNAADYGAAQRRRRVFLVARRLPRRERARIDAERWVARDGALARSLRARIGPAARFAIEGDLVAISERFGRPGARTPFAAAGMMIDREVWTAPADAAFRGRRRTLGDVLVARHDVPDRFLIPRGQVGRWRYLKGAKREDRTAANGHRYRYAEGAIAFPDALDQPSRTILTGEGGAAPSRFKHVVDAGHGRFRRLLPVELERLQGFPDDWTDTGMPEGWRAFAMGNAVVVDLIAKVGRALEV
jgi:DNA (cytosine-5)-methyltransferase 1